MNGPRHIKLLILTDLYEGESGGTEGQIAALIRNLPDHVEPELWAFQLSSFLEQGTLPCPTRRLEMPRTKNPFWITRMRRLAAEIRERGFDLIHAFNSDTALHAPSLGVRAGVPVITSRRDFGYWQTPFKIDWIRRANRFADLVIANAAAVGQRTVEVEWAPPSQVAVIGNGHDAARFEQAPDPDFRAAHGIPEGAPIVGLVANFRPIKRQVDLVEALAKLGRRLADLHVVFVGDPHLPYDASEVRARAQALGVSDRVHVVHIDGDVVPVLKHFSAGVLCSESEGLSNAILEYLGCGLPVLATDVGGNPELVEPGVNGFLFEPGNVGRLANDLAKVLLDEDLHARMGAAGRERFHARFRLDRMVAETVSRYSTVLARRDEPEPTFDVEIETSRDVLDALAPEWEPLCGPNAFFTSPLWVLTWLEISEAEPVVVLVRDEGRLVGVLPLARTGRTLGFCGQALGADHLDVVAAPENAEAVARSALRALDAVDYGKLVLRHVSEDAALRRALRHPNERRPFTERFATLCPYVTVSDDFDAYLEGAFSSKTRGRLRKARDAFFAREDAKVDRLTAPDDAERAVDRLLALHRVRADASGRDSSFDNRSARAFHVLLAKRLAAAGALFAAFLSAGGKDLAADYAFMWEHKLYAFQSGMAADDVTDNPGTILLAATLRADVFDRGLREYDFLDGDEPYKLRWATDVRRLYDIVVRPRSAIGRSTTFFADAAAFVRAAAKRKLKR